VRVLTPRNHGLGAWAYLTTFGGGMVDGDRVDVRASVGRGATAFLGTQSTTKVYRSRSEPGCTFRLAIDAEEGAAVAVAPDPVVCFSGARYTQQIDVTLSDGASLFLLDGYTCGRAARGERWEFARFEARTTIARGGAHRDRPAIVDATRLDPAHGHIGDRMGAFDVVLSLLVLGPRFAPVRAALLAAACDPGPDAVVSVSPLGDDGAILRVAASRFERASRALRSCFVELARILGDDPFARKW
jgi:urease accessory protein